MNRKKQNPFIVFVFVLILVSLACATSQPQTATQTSTPPPTATITASPTKTPRPSPTLRPTRTPNFAATEHVERLNLEVQTYYDQGYLATTKGRFTEFADFKQEWARLHWYVWWPLEISAGDFFINSHLKWSSAYRSADTSGCGFAFAIQKNYDNYAVFLDRSRIMMINMDQSFGHYRPMGLTSGTGRVKFDNPFDHPVEADFTLIVREGTAHVLVNGELAGVYTLAQDRRRGEIGLTLLSGTNKDYGTRCEMTNVHVWIPIK